MAVTLEISVRNEEEKAHVQTKRKARKVTVIREILSIYSLIILAAVLSGSALSLSPAR